jgi:hypothetical protein
LLGQAFHPHPQDNDKINIVLSYLGNESFTFSRKLTRLLRKLNLNIRIIFKKNRTIGSSSISNIKGSNSNNSGVIYKINCALCEKVYVGQTGKNITKRINQHIDNINNPKPTTYSNLVNHTKTEKHHFKFEEACVLAQDNNEKKRLIKETLHTKKLSNTAINDISFNT